MSPSEYLTSDHRRLETLFAAALETGEVDLARYDAFRIGLLRHIAIEETIVLPLVREGKGSFFADRQLHLEHGAIAALLVPPPTPDVTRALAALLQKHNLLEETDRTLYDVLDDCSRGTRPDLVDRMREHPAPPLSKNINNPDGLDPARRAVARAGYDFDKLAGG
ncbi:MAG: hemerythrin domain-containing protein [Bacteroidetes bacterium]|nr:hemerythrin domain-containing protein [Bacteroidota bacterium]